MKKSILILGAIVIGFASCKKEKPEPIAPTNPTEDPYANQKQQVKETYAALAFAGYSDAHAKALDLRASITTFIANPTSSNFDDAKQAWLDAREPYGQTEIFRFVDGPIDNPSDGPEGLINAWPMDEAYVDYVDGNANSGIINDLINYPSITVNKLVEANEFNGEENISVGYHAIEFLLWGQDLSAATAGVRPYTDYLTTGGTNSNQARRAQYLSICADLLVDALAQVKNAWDPMILGNYRATWLAMDNKTALRKMFNSIRVMSGTELSGERMYTAYDNQNQEDEHSCFSDNTHRDIALNSQGIENIYLGTYTKVNGSIVSGYSLSELVTLLSSTKDTEMQAALADAKTKISLMYTPFDQAIVLPAERPKVLEAINALLAEETLIVSIASDFAITF